MTLHKLFIYTWGAVLEMLKVADVQSYAGHAGTKQRLPPKAVAEALSFNGSEMIWEHLPHQNVDAVQYRDHNYMVSGQGRQRQQPLRQQFQLQSATQQDIQKMKVQAARVQVVAEGIHTLKNCFSASMRCIPNCKLSELRGE